MYNYHDNNVKQPSGWMKLSIMIPRGKTVIINDSRFLQMYGTFFKREANPNDVLCGYIL